MVPAALGQYTADKPALPPITSNLLIVSIVLV